MPEFGEGKVKFKIDDQSNWSDHVALFIILASWFGAGSTICVSLINHDHWILAFILALVVMTGMSAGVNKD